MEHDWVTFIYLKKNMFVLFFLEFKFYSDFFYFLFLKKKKKKIDSSFFKSFKHNFKKISYLVIRNFEYNIKIAHPNEPYKNNFDSRSLRQENAGLHWVFFIFVFVFVLCDDAV
jgi:hypothetical protein